MRAFWSCLMIAVLTLGCGRSQQEVATATMSPVSTQQAEQEVAQLAIAHCEEGAHGSLDHVATDGPLLIVGTAGEIIEGRASLDEVNASYGSRNVVVRHDCENVQRFVYAAGAGNVVWVEEAIRTHASWPGFTVDFPSQRTMIFEATEDGWRMRYYSLAVRLPDDQLDQAYAQPAEASSEPSEPGTSESPEAEPTTETPDSQ